jgi:hypothetical protein
MNKNALTQLIREMIEEESELAKAAASRGLHHIGFGRYADKYGKVVAKNVDGKLVDVPKGKKEPKTPPQRSADDDKLQQYRNRSWGASSALIGSEWEEKHRSLKPGDVTVDKKSNNPYVARDPDGNLAAFSNDAIAGAFSQGKTLKGYDFEKDYDGSMEKLKKELKPILDKFEKEGKKGKFGGFVKDLFTAFIDGASSPTSTSHSHKGKSQRVPRVDPDKSDKFGGFGGGGGFSGGGSSGRF